MNNAQLDGSEHLRAYATHDFGSDGVYQHGLASILAGGALNGKSGTEVEEILRRSRVFYFNSVTGGNVSMEEVLEIENSARNSDTHVASTATHTSGEHRILTFAELKELIETGKTDQIPNNKIIPDELNDAPPSESTAPSRRKPWETA